MHLCQQPVGQITNLNPFQISNSQILNLKNEKENLIVVGSIEQKNWSNNIQEMKTAINF